MMNIQRICGLLVLVTSMGVSSGGDGPGDDAVKAARTDLAGRMQVPVEQVVVVSRTEKTWPDRSLGCPRKDMMYAQVITNGSELVLEVAGQHYSYRARAGQPYSYCATADKFETKKSGAPTGTPRHDI